jgi:hypothetical protein
MKVLFPESGARMFQPALVIAGILCTTGLDADENLFGYTYTADVLPKGKWELEQWATTRVGKESGSFAATDLRTELEYGFTERIQGSLYLNYSYFHVHEAVAGGERLADRDRFGVSGVSSEWKYQLLSPFKDAFGLTFYLEPGYGTIEDRDGSRHKEIELEGKIIFEKHWFEDQLVGTFNFTVEPEWEKAAGDRDFEVHLKMEAATGLAWRIARHWHAGLETRVQTEFEGADLNRAAFVAAFAGPAIHYGAERWWATLTVLPQVAGWPDAHHGWGLTLDDHERLEIRLKAGYNF